MNKWNPDVKHVHRRWNTEPGYRFPVKYTVIAFLLLRFAKIMVLHKL